MWITKDMRLWLVNFWPKVVFVHKQLKLSLFDECSQLDISYSNTRFNDNFNTQPEEKISFTFSMDYLGFFGYEQSTDLFFKEPGSLNYGL